MASAEPLKWRKKPVVIEAMRFDGSNAEAVSEWAGPMMFGEVHVDDRGDDPDIVAEVFDTLHSTWVGVHVGDFIIKGVQGECYPCKPDVFDATYEPV